MEVIPTHAFVREKRSKSSIDLQTQFHTGVSAKIASTPINRNIPYLLDHKALRGSDATDVQSRVAMKEVFYPFESDSSTLGAPRPSAMVGSRIRLDMDLSAFARFLTDAS